MTQKGLKLAQNRLGLETALEALAVGPQHAALVSAARSLADQVDLGFDDKAWREYRLILVNLMEATVSGTSDGFDKFLKGLRAEVGDVEDAG